MLNREACSIQVVCQYPECKCEATFESSTSRELYFNLRSHGWSLFEKCYCPKHAERSQTPRNLQRVDYIYQVGIEDGDLWKLSNGEVVRVVEANPTSLNLFLLESREWFPERTCYIATTYGEVKQRGAPEPVHHLDFLLERGTFSVPSPGQYITRGQYSTLLKGSAGDFNRTVAWINTFGDRATKKSPSEIFWVKQEQESLASIRLDPETGLLPELELCQTYTLPNGNEAHNLRKIQHDNKTSSPTVRDYARRKRQEDPESVRTGVGPKETYPRFEDIATFPLEYIWIIEQQKQQEPKLIYEDWSKDPAASDRMRAASGEVKSNDPLVAFLYVVLRDGCPAGVMENALAQMHGSESLYTNGWLAKYAKDIAHRLKEKSDGVC